MLPASLHPHDRGRPMRLKVAGVASVALLVAGGVIFARRHAAETVRDARFVGSPRCAACHVAEDSAWRQSQHAVAMQEATPQTVLGLFDSTRVDEIGVTATFRREGSSYVATTTTADGAVRDFDVRFTFGVYPLQQYLVGVDGGRLHPLPIAWDARPSPSGGQRWFVLYPSLASADAGDAHWTGTQQSWNYMCADCHSTGVRKGYDAAARTFQTTQSEISVGCEGCHGPGSAHMAWAEAPAILRRIAWRDPGVRAPLSERRGVAWTIDSTSHTAKRSNARRTDREIDTCAQCHARRTHIAEGYSAGDEFRDFYDPLLLVNRLYHPDGQQREEVYTYGSFLQSKMYSAGVTCADCHDPHTQKLRRPGNQLCAQCHQPSTYDTSAHHFHRSGSTGARCTSCHMPDTTYMLVDPRHDHSLRVPRPDLTVAIGVPNACSRCHTDRSPAWAAEQIIQRKGHAPGGFQRFAMTFDADDHDLPWAADSLNGIANDSTHPPIARASALARLAKYPNERTLNTIRGAVASRDPQIRRASLDALDGFAVEHRLVARPLLIDPTRAVRIAAARVLASAAAQLSGADASAFRAASTELITSLRYNADRTASRLSLGALFVQLGQLDSALAEFRAANALSPRSAIAHVNAGEVLRLQGRAAEALAEVTEALRLDPGDPGAQELFRLLQRRE